MKGADTHHSLSMRMCVCVCVFLGNVGEGLCCRCASRDANRVRLGQGFSDEPPPSPRHFWVWLSTTLTKQPAPRESAVFSPPPLRSLYTFSRFVLFALFSPLVWCTMFRIYIFMCQFCLAFSCVCFFPIFLSLRFASQRFCD